MCLIVFQWDPDGATPLIVAANRDEFYARPAEAAHWWPGGCVLAGRDGQGGGTWMGVARNGRFAALTNYRDPSTHRPDARSRGAVVADFLAGQSAGQAYLENLRSKAAAYNDFNLLVYDGECLLGYESRFDCVVQFAAGVHAVSNARFDSPWPKAEAVKSGMPAALAARTALTDDEALFALLADQRVAADDLLPQTGIPLEWERALSSPFIRLPTYGTRCSTVLRLGREQVCFSERSFDEAALAGQVCFTFDIDV